MGIEIKVNGYDALITRITPGGPLGLTAIIVLSKPVQQLLSFGIDIPAKEYKKDELIGLVTRKAKERLDRLLKEKREDKLRKKEHLRLEELAKKLNAELGLA